MYKRIVKKIKSNLKIYRNDIETKGFYWSVVHRIYKFRTLKRIISPFVDYLKPDFLIIDRHKLYIDKKDTAVSQELLLSGTWEEFETNLFKNNIKPDDIVIDIGAHIGYYTLIAARLVGQKGKVYAFEPNPDTFQILKRNVKENGYKNVVLINKAISDKDSEAKLFLNKSNTGDHRLYDSKDNRKFVDVSTISLDSYFRDKNKKINLIKMDIQGSEVKAFKGGLKTIRKNKYIKIITEIWPMGISLAGNTISQYLDMLANENFKYYEIDEKKKRLKDINLLNIYNNTKREKDFYTNLLCIKS